MALKFTKNTNMNLHFFLLITTILQPVFNEFEISIKFSVFFSTLIEFLCKKLSGHIITFANFDAKYSGNGFKNLKILYKCVLELNFASISGSRLYFFSKNDKIVVPYYTAYLFWSTAEIYRDLFLLIQKFLADQGSSSGTNNPSKHWQLWSSVIINNTEQKTSFRHYPPSPNPPNQG